jgi:Tol biopolymer transport system component
MRADSVPASVRLATFVAAAVLAALRSVSASAQQVTRVSVDSSGAQGDQFVDDVPVISADGSLVAFASYATNMVAGDSNSAEDVFVHDRGTGVTELVSVDSNGIQGNKGSSWPALSTDGRFVAFSSVADGLVAGDTNGVQDVFVHDRTTGITERISVDSSGLQGDDASYSPTISGDGQIVAFESLASNLVPNDNNPFPEIFLHDRSTGITTRLSVNSSGAQPNGRSDWPAISRDGQVVAFYSEASNLVAGDTNGAYDTFVYDRKTARLERVSVSSSGAQANSASCNAALSSDGSLVAFNSAATNLIPGGTKQRWNVYLHDRTLGSTQLVSVNAAGVEPDGESVFPSITDDGSVVGFSSEGDDLVAGDTNGVGDVFVRDLRAGTNAIISLNCAGAPGDDYSELGGALSSDGTVVAFLSFATNLIVGDTNGFDDIFVNDLTVPPLLASWSTYGTGYPGTLGIPTLLPRANPVFGSTLYVDASDSSGGWSVAFLILGASSASIPTSAGGDLLVAPSLFELVGLPPGGATFFGEVPRDPALSGVSFFMQVLEQDPGALRNISFTPGLELVFGL